LACWFPRSTRSSLPSGGWLHAFWVSLRGGAVGFSLCWVVAELGERLFKKEAMGGGDIKLWPPWERGPGAWELSIA